MLESRTSVSTTLCIVPRQTYEGQGVDTATAMKIIGHKSERMWKRYNSIEEEDLTLAAGKVHKYLSGVNTQLTPAGKVEEGNPRK